LYKGQTYDFQSLSFHHRYLCAASDYFCLLLPREEKEQHYLKAMEYIKKDENTAAVLELRNAIQIDPKYAQARYQLGLIYLKQNDPRNAFAELQRTAGLDPANLDAGVKVAEFLLISKKNEESRKYVEQVLEKDPAYTDALALLANIELLDGNFKEAEDAVSKIEGKDAETDRIYNIRGRILAAQKKWPESQDMFQKAVERGPDNFSNYRTLLLFFQQQKNETEVKNLLSKIQEKFPDNPQSYTLMASLYQSNKEMGKAEDELKKAIKVSPDTIAIRLMLLDLYKSQNKLDVAEKDLREFIKEKPDAIELKTALADLLFDLQKFDESKKVMDEILAKNPENGGANVLKAKFLLKDGKNREGIEILTPLTTSYPKWAEPFFYLALAHLGQGEIELAQKNIDTALQNGPSVSRYHTLAAQIYLVKGESDAAGKAASIAISLENRNFSAVKLLAKALIQGKKFKEAVALIENVEKQVSNDADLIGNLGLAYLGLEDKEKAKATFSRLLEISPDNSKALALLTALTAGNDAQKAKTIIQEQIAKTPKAGGHYMLLGDLLVREKDYDEAITAYKMAQELAPNNPQPYVVIARLMSSLGKTDEAIKELQDLLAKQPDSLPGNMGPRYPA
jgi:tetratricopeptide (TPR) repeat protein